LSFIEIIDDWNILGLLKGKEGVKALVINPEDRKNNTVEKPVKYMGRR
jgi:hypothetical protein